MARQPLSNSEINKLIDGLLRDYKTDRDRALFLAGLKLGTATAGIMEKEEVLRFCKLALNFQMVFDPEGETWSKNDK